MCDTRFVDSCDCVVLAIVVRWFTVVNKHNIIASTSLTKKHVPFLVLTLPKKQ